VRAATNGMHPTADTTVLKFLQSPRGGDAGVRLLRLSRLNCSSHAQSDASDKIKRKAQKECQIQ